MTRRTTLEKPGRKSARRDDYLELVKQFPLRPLRTAAEYTAAAKTLDTLVLRFLERPTRESAARR